MLQRNTSCFSLKAPQKPVGHTDVIYSQAFTGKQLWINSSYQLQCLCSTKNIINAISNIFI